MNIWMCKYELWASQIKVISSLNQPTNDEFRTSTQETMAILRLALWIPMITLPWRHNGRDSVSIHQPPDCLLNRLFRRRSKRTPKLRVIGLCGGIHRGPVYSPHKWPVTRKMSPFDDVIMKYIVSPILFLCMKDSMRHTTWRTNRIDDQGQDDQGELELG